MGKNVPNCGAFLRSRAYLYRGIAVIITKRRRVFFLLQNLVYIIFTAKKKFFKYIYAGTVVSGVFIFYEFCVTFMDVR